MVEHHVRDVGVASSNLVTSTKKDGFFSRPLFLSVSIFGLVKPNFRLCKKMRENKKLLALQYSLQYLVMRGIEKAGQVTARLTYFHFLQIFLDISHIM